MTSRRSFLQSVLTVGAAALGIGPAAAEPEIILRARSSGPHMDDVTTPGLSLEQRVDRLATIAV